MRRVTRDLSLNQQTGLIKSQKFDDVVRHIVVCVFNRATYSRVKALIDGLEKSKGFKVTVLGSGLPDYVKCKNIHLTDFPATHLGSVQKSAQISAKYAEYFEKHRNEITAIMVVADRFETLGAAMAASYLNIPLLHLQGGEVTGNIDEKVRHAVTKLSDYHFVATRLAEKYVIRLGENPFRVFKTGCPSLDVIQRARINRTKSTEKYIIVQFHPETDNPADAAAQTHLVMSATVDFCKREGFHAYVYWPNPDPGREDVIRVLEKFHEENKVCLVKAPNLEPEKFLWQLASCGFMVGNSSCGIRECSYLGVPAINIGERQATRERSYNVIDVDYDFEDIVSAMMQQHFVKRFTRSYLYGNGESVYEIIDRLYRINYTQKPPLTYPTLTEFRRSHFGEDRFKKHKANAKRTVREPLPDQP